PVARMVYLFSPLWRVKVEGVENFDPTKRYVVTSNHQSFFDIPLLFFLPLWKFKFVSKIEVRKIPAIGWMLGMRGDIVIRRGTREAATTVMEEGTQHLQAGVSVAIFPEGTRTKDGEVHRFKDGAFRLAQENKVAILPCVMDDTKGLFSASGLNRRNLTIRILPPIEVEEVVNTPARELAERVERITREALAEIRAPKSNEK
ncbi:MAG: 1-acyl-sn-glycerol-3-phosphate acyltransferase, partial [Tidjanibacter sp.]|nr:1-acyl-sn-glycerol-3-phosphate acyltransferase [Tidjanibacter sp.]